MKKILITGANSYIGCHIEKEFLKEKEKYEVDILDVKNKEWPSCDFSLYDVVIHVAGIAHVSTNKKFDALYFSVNRDLAMQVANKAKQSGVKQFVFMSSMIIYGKDNNFYNKKPVNTNLFNPINAYGKSKLEADLYIQSISDEMFKTIIIRSPVVYGPLAKGNFLRLQKLAKFGVMPHISNMRSMIYIDNLTYFIKNVVANNENGVFYPQNAEYVSTVDVIKFIRNKQNKKLYKSPLFGLIVKIASLFSPSIRKVFGNKYYDKKASLYDFNYQIVDFTSSLKKTFSNQEM